MAGFRTSDVEPSGSSINKKDVPLKVVYRKN
jgi:hypothetical protein